MRMGQLRPAASCLNKCTACPFLLMPWLLLYTACSVAQFADDGRLEDDWVPDEEARDPEEIEKANR